MDILNLPDIDVIERTQSKNQYVFKVRYTLQPASCPHCNRMLPRLYRFGSKTQAFRDLPIHGKQVELRVVRARYRCRECGQTFYEDVPHLDDKRRATKRFTEYAQEKSLTRTFVSLADELGVDERTIRNIFKDYVRSLEKTFIFETPIWLGIDEIHLLGKPRCVLANVGERTIFDILETRKPDTVARRLMRMKDREKIELVAMDMWQPYRDAVRAVLPQAVIVIDKFHVVRMANTALESIRKRIREGLTDRQRRRLMHDRFLLLRRKRDLKPDKLLILESWLNSFPTLKTTYELKEELFDLWDSPVNSAEAKKKYREWEASIPQEIAWVFKDLATAVSNWEQEIFAYFDHRVTNAYTESLNGLTKLANRMGRGYSFDVIRAKVLFSMKEIHKKPKIEVLDEVHVVTVGVVATKLLELLQHSSESDEGPKFIRLSPKKRTKKNRRKSQDSPSESE